VIPTSRNDDGSKTSYDEKSRGYANERRSFCSAYENGASWTTNGSEASNDATWYAWNDAWNDAQINDGSRPHENDGRSSLSNASPSSSVKDIGVVSRNAGNQTAIESATSAHSNGWKSGSSIARCAIVVPASVASIAIQAAIALAISSLATTSIAIPSSTSSTSSNGSSCRNAVGSIDS